MGREARCVVRYRGEASVGTALLESDEVVFRGDFRLRIPFRDMTRIEAVEGCLEIDWPEGTAVFELGRPEAERWAARITNPPSLMGKLGVEAGARVAVLEIHDESFWKDLRSRVETIADGVPAGPCDVVFWGVRDTADLARLASLLEWIPPDGAIWAVWRKGRKELTENHIRHAALAAGLVDIKVASFSTTHSALKLVIPKARRGS